MKKKVLFILFIVLFMFITLSSQCFAYSVEGNDCILTIPDELYQKVISSEYYTTSCMVFVNNSNDCYDVLFIEYDKDLYFLNIGGISTCI